MHIHNSKMQPVGERPMLVWTGKLMCFACATFCIPTLITMFIMASSSCPRFIHPNRQPRLSVVEESEHCGQVVEWLFGQRHDLNSVGISLRVFDQLLVLFRSGHPVVLKCSS